MLSLKLTYCEDTLPEFKNSYRTEKETVRTFNKITHAKQMDFNCQLNASMDGLLKNNNTVYMVVVEANTSDSSEFHKNAHCEPVFSFLDKEKARKLAKTIKEMNDINLNISFMERTQQKTSLEIINDYRKLNGFLPYTPKNKFDFEYMNEIIFIDDRLQSNITKMFWNSFGYSLFDVKIIKRQVEDYGDDEFY